MAEMTLEEAQNKVFDVEKLSDAEILRMNKLLQAESSKEGATEDDKTATDIVKSEMQTRLEAYSKLDSFELGDLDNVIAMAGAVSGFSQQADMAKEVLARAQAQKASLTSEQLNEAAAEAIMKDPSYSKEEVELAWDAGAQYNQEISDAKKQEASQQQTTENVQAEPTVESKADEPYKSHHDQVMEDVNQQLLDLAARSKNNENNKTSNEAPKEEETSTQQVEDGIEVVDNQTKSNSEINIDNITQEQLEANDKILDNIQKPIDKNGKLIANQEFAQEYTALKNLTITNETGRELTPEEQEEARMSLVEAAQLEAETYALAAGNGNPEEVKKLYNERYKEALRNNVIAAVFATDFKKGMTKEQISQKFLQAVEKPQKADLKAINAVAARSATQAQGVVSKLKDKFKSIPAVQKMENKVKDFDKKMTDRYGSMYTISRDIAMNLGKVGMNLVKYSALGAVAGTNAPLVFAAIAAKGAYDTLYTMREDAKKQKKTFWQYFKDNKFKVGTTCLTTTMAVGGAVLGLGGGAENADTKSQLTMASRGLAVFKHAAPAFLHTASGMYKKYVKKDENGAAEDMKKAKGEWKQSGMALVGVLTGTMASPWIADKVNDVKDYAGEFLGTGGDAQAAEINESQQPVASQNQQMAPEEMSKTLEAMGLSPDMIEHMSPEAQQAYIITHLEDFQSAQMMQQDKDGDGIADALDADHGQGWATANETQLNRLMDADPAKVNALLNDGEWHSSDELKSMMESGQFNDEQLKGIHELATREFDENGHIIDADLNAYYENLAKEAATQEAHIEEGDNKEPENKQPENKQPENKQPENNQSENKEPEQAPQLKPEDQRAYEEILKVISKGEDMNNPEVRASVEGLARSHLQDIKEALNKGETMEASNIIAALHHQGEHQEVFGVTRVYDEDSRHLANAKKDVWEAKLKLDAATEALDQNPDDTKLQEKVAKLEQKFAKESLDLEQRIIKETNSEIKEQLEQDKQAYDNRAKSYETIEKNFGLTEEQVNQNLAKMGFDINNLPKDVSTLPQEAQDMINIHGMYEKAHQNETALQDRIKFVEHEKDSYWQKLEEQSQADEKALKQSGKLSLDAQERLAGNSKVENSELLHSVRDMLNPQQETEDNAEKTEARKVQELRGIESDKKTPEVRQTNLNTQTIVQTKGKELS